MEEKIKQEKLKVADEKYINYENLGKLIPLVTIYIILLGLISQFLYYSNFNVPIKYFLSVSELGLIISDELLFFSIVTVIMGFMSFFAVSNSSEGPVLKIPERKRRNLLKLTAVFMVIIMVLAMLFSPTYVIMVKLVGFSIIVIPMAFLVFYEKRISVPKSKILFFIFLLFLLTGLLINYVGYKIQIVETGKYNGTKIYFAGDLIPHISTDSSYFIGKTEKYVFIYNKFDTTTTIIPSEDVKKIILKSK